MADLRYFRTAERPDLKFWLLDDDGALVNLASGYTFTFKIGTPNATAVLTKTTGITGAAGTGTSSSGTPNLVVSFTAGELDSLAVRQYTWQIRATATSLDRIWQGKITIADVIL
jgi:hypothetical protein